MSAKEVLKQTINSSTATVQTTIDGMNITPRISVEQPIVNNGFRSIIDELLKFVAVGGDFV